MMRWVHAFFELLGMIAVGYVISRLLLTIPVIKNFLISNSKQRVESTDNPNPVVNDCKPENRKNKFSDSAPIKNLDDSNDYPLGKNTHDVPAAPFSKKASKSAHDEKSISDSRDHND
jgi:hypothetical protein